MNILITGGGGFIGTALYEQLKDKHNVKRIDINKGEGIIRMDLANLFDSDRQLLHTLIQASDVVYHLASSIGVEAVTKNPNKTLQNSNRINNNIIPLFTYCKAKLIFASTSEVYGSKDWNLSEDDDLFVSSPGKSMRGGYAAQKIMGEFLTKSHANNYTIVRFFNVTGKQQQTAGMVFPTFFRNAIRYNDLKIYGDGTQTRSYCDIRDAVNVLELLITEMDNEILNIGANNVYSTSYLAEEIIEFTGSQSKIVYEPGRVAEIQSRVPNLSKQDTIYKTKYSLKDIMNG